MVPPLLPEEGKSAGKSGRRWGGELLSLTTPSFGHPSYPLPSSAAGGGKNQVSPLLPEEGISPAGPAGDGVVTCGTDHPPPIRFLRQRQEGENQVSPLLPEEGKSAGKSGRRWGGDLRHGPPRPSDTPPIHFLRQRQEGENLVSPLLPEEGKIAGKSGRRWGGDLRHGPPRPSDSPIRFLRQRQEGGKTWFPPSSPRRGKSPASPAGDGVVNY